MKKYFFIIFLFPIFFLSTAEAVSFKVYKDSRFCTVSNPTATYDEQANNLTVSATVKDISGVLWANITLNGVTTGMSLIDVNNDIWMATYAPPSVLPPGSYTVSFSASDRLGNHPSVNGTEYINFSVSKKEALLIISSDPSVSSPGSLVSLTAVLKDNDSGIFLSGKSIQFSDITSTPINIGSPVQTDSSGSAKISYTIPASAYGSVSLKAFFTGDAEYDNASSVANVVILPATTITFDRTTDVVERCGVVTLWSNLKSGSRGLSNKTVNFYNDGIEIGTAITDTYGAATLERYIMPVNTALGNHNFKADFKGDSQYGASESQQKNITVSVMKPSLSLSQAPYGSAQNQIVQLTGRLMENCSYSGISGKNIRFYDVTRATDIGSGATDSSGYFRINYVVPSSLLITPSTRDIKVSFDGDSDYSSNNKTVTFNVAGIGAYPYYSNAEHNYYQLAAIPGDTNFFTAHLDNGSPAFSGKSITFTDSSGSNVFGSAITGGTTGWGLSDAVLNYSVPNNMSPGVHRGFFKAYFGGDESYLPNNASSDFKVARITTLDLSLTPNVSRGYSFNGYPIALPNDNIFSSAYLKMSSDNVQPPSLGVANQNLIFSTQSDPNTQINQTTSSTGNTVFNILAPAIMQNTISTGVTANECDYWVSGDYFGGSDSVLSPSDFYAPDTGRFNFISLGMPTKFTLLNVYGSTSSSTPLTSIKKGTRVYIRAILKDKSETALASKTIVFRNETNSSDIGTATTGSNGIANLAWTPAVEGCYVISAKFYSTGNYCGSSTLFIPSVSNKNFKVCATANTCSSPVCP